MVKDVIYNSQGKDRISMSPSVGQATEKLRDFMFQRVYIDSFAKTEEKRPCMCWKNCFNYFMKAS
jgi:dGTPase